MILRGAGGQGYRDGTERATVEVPMPETLPPALPDSPESLAPSDTGVEGHRRFEMEMAAEVWA